MPEIREGGCQMQQIEEIADAILFAWYPGQQGGNAVADIIFGDISPSGRLPITFPMLEEQLPPYEDYSMAGRTYKYMTEMPMYPFGFGLSFTQFEYSDLALSADQVAAGDAVKVELTVRNTGAVDADEVVQIYITVDDAKFEVPSSTLIDFRRVHLKSGESKSVTFTIASAQMRVFDREGASRLVPGRYTVRVGGVSPGERGEELTGIPMQNASFELR